jgi:Flp pilus assembly pilin Flp
MSDYLRRIWAEDDGVMSFEWTLVVTLTTVGVVGGIAATRDAIIDELGDVSQAMLALDGSYSISYPLEVTIAPNGGAAMVVGRASDSAFFDTAVFNDCNRLITELAP